MKNRSWIFVIEQGDLYMESIKDYLLDYIEKNGYSLRKFSNLVDMDRAQIKRYLSGDRIPFSEKYIEKMALGMNLNNDEMKKMISVYRIESLGLRKKIAYEIIDHLENGNELQNIIYNKGNEKYENVFCESLLLKIKEICCNSQSIKLMWSDSNNDIYEKIVEFSNKNCVFESIICFKDMYSKEDFSDVERFEKQVLLFQHFDKCTIYCKYASLKGNLSYNYIIADNKIIIIKKKVDKAGKIIFDWIASDNEVLIDYYLEQFYRIKMGAYLYGNTFFENKERTGYGLEIVEINNEKAICIKNTRCMNKSIIIFDRNVLELIYEYRKLMQEISGSGLGLKEYFYPV